MSGMPIDLPTPVLLRLAYNRLSEDIFRRVAAAGFADLRPAHGNALESLAIEDGLRLTDLAARAGIASQSMGELVDDLVAKGYLERREDPADRRAKRIYLTDEGRANAEAGRAATREVEERLSDLLGTRHYHQLRSGLSRIITPLSAEAESVAESLAEP